METIDNTVSAIRETCVLVSFHGGYYGWKRRDRNAEREYASYKGVTSNAGEYRKNLFVGTDALLASAKSLITEARAAHYHITLPSPYDGESFIRNVNIMKYKTVMTQFQHKLDFINSALQNEWPTMKAAARNVLGAMYDEQDYPSVNAVIEANYIKTVFKPIPAGANVILDGVDAEIRQEIADSIDNGMSDAFKQANLAAWKRLIDIIDNAKKNLTKSVDDGGRFRTEWYDNLAKLLDVMDGLNITNDADLADFSEQAHTLLQYSPDALKQSTEKRDEIATKADKIFSDMSSIFASIGGGK